jgi:2-polyprenyl-3-methyl-5-hydroxy-6-metoxy-1,4-benzoquinol methylase
MDTVLSNDTGSLRITTTPQGRLALHARPNGVDVGHNDIVTDYSLELIQEIFKEIGASYTIEEIGRDIADNDAQLDVRYSVLAYFPDDLLNRTLKILDYGCGSGSSTLALSRLFPNAAIIGMDFVGKYLRLAQLRMQHYGLNNAQFHQVPSSGRFSGFERFDLVFLNAVYEHLLPSERPVVLESLWKALKPGGSLILNQTPHRWFPIETHTSALPLINYLPASLARWAQIRLSKRSFGVETWEQLLRRGIRGATVSEIVGNIKRVDRGARLLKPFRISSSWAGIWYAAKRERMRDGFMAQAVKTVGKAVNATRVPFAPYISIAVLKP